MKRRNFLKRLPLALSIPFTIGGIPIKVLADNQLTALLQANADNDNVLIVLQMHGGNDGLNTLIPVEKYEQYYSRRPNIAIPAKDSLRKYIPLDSTLPSDAQVGLHPDMLAMKALYDQGRVTFVQGVSYENNNGSHFRGRDISFMGGGSNDYFDSGWLGRYLADFYFDKGYGTYPDSFNYTLMPDPLALEMGSEVSLLFHQKGNIPTSLSIDEPDKFEDFINELNGFDDLSGNRGFPPDFLEASPYGKELDWILKIEDKSKDYAARLAKVYADGGATSITYPQKYPYNAPSGSLDNPLSKQLQLIARLLAGGCKTRVFLVKVGGFDTHADQVESYDPTMGSHAALLFHISSAMKAFQEDLRSRGSLENRVLTVTTSEFGRRISSNGSFGTDHGTGGPIYIFGKGVKPGVVGKVPNLDPDVHNIEMQYDYRQVYANIMKDWMGVDETKISTVLFGDQKTDPVTARNFVEGPRLDNENLPAYTPMPLATTVITGIDEFVSTRFALKDCYPNPAKNKTTMSFMVNSSNLVTINLMDIEGRPVKTLINKNYEPGEHKEEVDLTGLPTGNYIYQMKTEFYKGSKKLVIIK